MCIHARFTHERTSPTRKPVLYVYCDIFCCFLIEIRDYYIICTYAHIGIHYTFFSKLKNISIKYK